MKGDFSRSTFREKKHYRKVKMQQGRVQVDADWNEQVDIQSHIDSTSFGDVIGKSGTSDDGSFKITPAGPTFKIGKGNYYVDGILIENDQEIFDGLSGQPDLPKDSKPLSDGYFIVYLDVWQRHLTFLDDPTIQESALGGADTATRAKTVWQVKLENVGTSPDNLDGHFPTPWIKIANPSTGTLAARSKPGGDTNDNACILPPGAGYRRLQNHLYRIEVHDGSDSGTPTFKWSRDNGSVVTKITKISGNKLSVADTGKDSSLGFATGQWVEILDDRNELLGTPGTFARLIDVDAANGTLTFDAKVAPNTSIEFNPKVRRWDCPTGPIKIEVPGTNDGYIPLEDGVEVKFSSGTYKNGDYWLVPARTEIADIEWPRTNNVSDSLLPEGIQHHFAALGMLSYSNKTFQLIRDYRRIFPAITNLTTMQYLGGDGQRGKPSETLASPLRIGVSRGNVSLSGVSIRFEILDGNGGLYSSIDESKASNLNVNSVMIKTNDSGIALCYWKLGPTVQNQRVQATLLDVESKAMHLPILFSAVMDPMAPPVTSKIHSGIISTTIRSQTSKIVGPFYHNLDISESTATPSILLGTTNIVPGSVNMQETVAEMGGLSFLPILNKQLGIPSIDKRDTFTPQFEISSYFDQQKQNPIPVFYKPVAVDKEKFHVLLANYNKNPTQIQWSDWADVHSIKALQVDMAKNKDGRLVMVAINQADNSLHQAIQQEPGGDWNALQPLSQMTAKQIVIGTNADGRLEVFAINADKTPANENTIYHISQNPAGDWSAPSTLSGVKATQISVGNNVDGRLELFAVGTDGVLYHIRQISPNGSWSQWVTHPGVNVTQITVSNNEDGRLEVFAIVSTSKPATKFPPSMVATTRFTEPLLLSSRFQKSRFLNVTNVVNGNTMLLQRMPMMEEKLGIKSFAHIVEASDRIAAASIAKEEVVAKLQPDVVTAVLAFDVTNTLYHIWQTKAPDGSWSDWNSLGGLRVKQIDAGTNEDGRIEVFAIDENNSLWHIWQTSPNGPYGGWSNMGGHVEKIVVASNDDGRLEVFAISARSKITLSSGLVLNSSEIANVKTISELQKVRKTTSILDANILQDFLNLKSNTPNVESTNALYHIWQTSPNNGWSPWSSLKGTFDKISANNNDDGRIEVLAIGSDGTIHDSHQLFLEIAINLRWWAFSAVSMSSNLPGQIAPDSPTLAADKTSADKLAAADKAASDKLAAADKAAAAKIATAEKIASEKLAAADKISADKSTADKVVADKLAAADKAAADKLASADQAAKAKLDKADKITADGLAAEKAASDKLAAADKAASDRLAAAEKVVSEKLAAAEKASSDKIAADKAVADKLAAADKAASTRISAADSAAAAKLASADSAAAAKLSAADKTASEKLAAADKTIADRLRVIRNPP